MEWRWEKPCKNFLRAWEAKPWVRLSVDGTSKRYFVTAGPHCAAPAAASPLAPLPKPRALPALATHVARGPAGGRGRRSSRARFDAHISRASRIGRNACWHGAPLASPHQRKRCVTHHCSVAAGRGGRGRGGQVRKKKKKKKQELRQRSQKKKSTTLFCSRLHHLAAFNSPRRSPALVRGGVGGVERPSFYFFWHIT